MPKTYFVFEKELATDFLNSIYDDDLEYATIIFEQYLQQTPLLLKDMEESFQKGAVEEFRRRVHKIKPVFSYVGLSKLTTQAEQLEKKCKEVFDINELDQMYAALKRAIDQFRPVIENQLIKLKQQTAA